MNLPVMVPGLGRDALVEWCRRIDAGPWSHVAAGERITFPNPEILVTLSAAALATERVDVFPHVIVLPMHDAVLVAKQLATLDVLSGGRLRVGLGAGAREEDFRAIGADFGARRVSRLAEQAEVLRRTWSGGLVAARSHLLHPGSRFRFLGRQDYRGGAPAEQRPSEGPPT